MKFIVYERIRIGYYVITGLKMFQHKIQTPEKVHNNVFY